MSAVSSPGDPAIPRIGSLHVLSADNDNELNDGLIRPDKSIQRAHTLDRALRALSFAMWIILVILCSPLLLIYFIGIGLVNILSPLKHFIWRNSFTLAATTLYISRSGRVVHKSEKPDPYYSTKKLKRLGIVRGHAKSLMYTATIGNIANNGAHRNVSEDDTNTVHVHSISVLQDNINYLLINPVPIHGALECVLIDGSDEIALKAFLDRKEVEYGLDIIIKAIICTHTHWDHVMGVHKFVQLLRQSRPELYEKDGPAVICNAAERGRNKFVTHYIEDIQDRTVELRIANLPLTIFHCAGHTKGSMIIKLNSEPPMAFTGDSLFSGGCGNPFESNAQTFYHNILRVTTNIEPRCLILPGHDYTIDNLHLAVAQRIREMKNLTYTIVEDYVDDSTSLHPTKVDYFDNDEALKQLELMSSYRIYRHACLRKREGELCVGTTLEEETFLNPSLSQIKRAMGVVSISIRDSIDHQFLWYETLRINRLVEVSENQSNVSLEHEESGDSVVNSPRPTTTPSSNVEPRSDAIEFILSLIQIFQKLGNVEKKILSCQLTSLVAVSASPSENDSVPSKAIQPRRIDPCSSDSSSSTCSCPDCDGPNILMVIIPKFQSNRFRSSLGFLHTSTPLTIPPEKVMRGNREYGLIERMTGKSLGIINLLMLSQVLTRGTMNPNPITEDQSHRFISGLVKWYHCKYPEHTPTSIRDPETDTNHVIEWGFHKGGQHQRFPWIGIEATLLTDYINEQRKTLTLVIDAEVKSKYRSGRLRKSNHHETCE